jgi:hypothetical protein
MVHLAAAGRQVQQHHSVVERKIETSRRLSNLASAPCSQRAMLKCGCIFFHHPWFRMMAGSSANSFEGRAMILCCVVSPIYR